LIFLDAELYIDRVKAPELLRALQTGNALPPVAAVYLSSPDPASRHVDFTCNEAFSSFLASELGGWIDQTVGSYERFILCGLSLSGLSAAFTTLRYPGAFSGTLCQSPSAWWNDEWFSASLKPGVLHGNRFWISVGSQELQSGVSHPPSGLFQKTNQLDSVRRLAEKLTGLCQDVHYAEFSGGHDPACWAAELPHALSWLTRKA
jgi:enterochelin esterase family protein